MFTAVGAKLNPITIITGPTTTLNCCFDYISSNHHRPRILQRVFITYTCTYRYYSACAIGANLTMPMKIDTIYPTIIPISTGISDKNPLKQ
jgi:hypothetical protein